MQEVLTMCFGNDTQRVVTSQDIPSWLLPFYQEQAASSRETLPIAKQIYQDNAEYTPYDEPRIQEFTTDQLTAMEMARKNLGMETRQAPDGSYFVVGTGPALGQQDLATSSDLLTRGAKTWEDTGRSDFAPGTFDSASAAKYMNPYTDQVMQTTLAELDRRNEINRLSDQGRAAKAGAFGGTGMDIMNAERDRNHEQLVAQTVSKMNEANFAQAQGQFNTEQNMGLNAFNTNQGQFATNQGRLLQAGQQAGGLASLRQAMGGQDVASLMAVGDIGQQFGQRNLDLAYGDFQRQQAYPYQQVSWLQSAIQGKPVDNPSMFATQNQTQPGPSSFSQIAGAGLTGLGLAGSLGWSPFK
jgi:hypothetical protein